MLSEAESATGVRDIGWRSSKPLCGDPMPICAITLFHADSYWRDVLALTWHIVTVNGADAIREELKACPPCATERFSDRSAARSAAQGETRRHRGDRSDLPI